LYNSSLLNNRISTTYTVSTYPFYLYSSNYNKFNGNNYSSAHYGFILRSANNNNFKNEYFFTTNDVAEPLYVHDSTNNTIEDSIIYDAAGSYDIYFYPSTTNGLLNLTNVTRNIGVTEYGSGTTGYIYNNWYIFANVTDVNSNYLAGATVKAYDNNTELRAQGTSTGSLPLLKLIAREYMENATRKYYINNNYTVNVSKQAYLNKSQSFNLTGNVVVNFTMELANTPPTTPILVSPSFSANIVNRTPMFSWTNSTDAQGDPIFYNLTIKCYSALGGSCSPSDDRYYTGITTNYTIITEPLKYFGDDNYYYNWTVAAYDDKGAASNVSNESNFTVSIYIALNFSVDKIDFGSLNNNENDNTDDNNPNPFVLDNIGNVPLNLNISATRLFTTVPHPSDYYQCKADNRSGYEGAFNSSTNTSWFNVPATTTVFAYDFNYTTNYNSMELDINITVPTYEGAGAKGSILNVFGWYDG